MAQGKPSYYLNDRDSGIRFRANALSKNTWMDLYVDLYRETVGEQSSVEDILADAERRLAILRLNGLR